MNTGDQDISGIAINATNIATNTTDIDALEAEQVTQNDAIAINTAKTGITTAQADIIANTSGINTGDQDISGIAINATDIATNTTDIDALEAEQIVQNDAIAINTAKTGITTAQADIIANTSGVNTGDQDISGIAVNATDIDALEAEQIVQNDAIAINTAKTGITTAQADIIANTSGSEHGRSGYFGYRRQRNQHCDKYDRHRCPRSGTDRSERRHRHQHRKNRDYDSTGRYHREHFRSEHG